MADVRPDHRWPSGVNLIAHPAPPFLGILRFAYVETDAEMLADVSLKVGGAAHEIYRWLHPGHSR